MSKCISLVDLLGVVDSGTEKEESIPGNSDMSEQPSQAGVLKPSDIRVFSKIQERMCQELKDSMQVAIDQFNNELEASQTQEGHQGGEEHVKTIAHMFKLINMQEEGMRFYSNFIMLGKHNVVSNNQAAEQSTIKKCNDVINSMFIQVEEQRLKEEREGTLLLEEISFSTFYAEFQKVLIECIEDYGESITNLFGLDSLILFLSQIDRHSKEKGTQIIEHFMHNTNLEKYQTEVLHQGSDCQLSAD